MFGGRRTIIFVLLSLGASTLLWVSAAYFRRKRRQRLSLNSSKDDGQGNKISGRGSKSRSANLDAIERLRAGSALTRASCLESSKFATDDGKLSEDSGAVDLQCSSEDEQLIQHLITKGVKDFEAAVEHWNTAADHIIQQQQASTIVDGEIQIHEKTHQEITLSTLLSNAQRLRMAIVLQGLAPNEAFAITPQRVMGWVEEETFQAEEGNPDADSDADSFVSASESAALEYDDLIDDKFIRESEQLRMFRQTIIKAAGSHSHLELYVTGLEHYARCDVECRKMRTAEVGCDSDMEFLAKVYCLRQASELAFSSRDNCTWFANSGRFLLSSIIRIAGKNPTDFIAAFDELLEYCAAPENLSQIEEELQTRGVPMLSFYDVILDYVLLDAFDDLATPPYSVATAIQNRWLSASIKETELLCSYKLGISARLLYLVRWLKTL
ncbi:mitoguardin 2 isoform X2 [Nematostella vectensis]|uniref:mitoguardin 2 isoform X2 n=1 Tax=Nematostella vectensis TaxID=45351 RepID=UPI002076ECBE|nr:mitoguardin 2 isoform X2 [Nematostella vectensis]